MHRVELKAILKKCYDLAVYKFLMHRVELKEANILRPAGIISGSS